MRRRQGPLAEARAERQAPSRLGSYLRRLGWAAEGPVFALLVR